MNRRQFVSAATAAGVCLPRVLAGAAVKCDLLIQGGRVSIPRASSTPFVTWPSAMAVFWPLRPICPRPPAETIDASGKLVMPGLIDIHTPRHAHEGWRGAVSRRRAITGLIDAGSQGADHIDDAIAVAKSAPQQFRVLINIGRAGIIPEGDTMDINRADVAAAREAIEAQPRHDRWCEGAAFAATSPVPTILRCSSARKRWRRRPSCP